MPHPQARFCRVSLELRECLPCLRQIRPRLPASHGLPVSGVDLSSGWNHDHQHRVLSLLQAGDDGDGDANDDVDVDSMIVVVVAGGSGGTCSRHVRVLSPVSGLQVLQA